MPDTPGQPIRFDKSNVEQMTKLAAGDYTWRPKGGQGPGFKVSNTRFNVSGADLRSFAGAPQQVSGVLRIEMDPSAERAGVRVLNTVRLTPHEEKANMAMAMPLPTTHHPVRARYPGDGEGGDKTPRRDRPSFLKCRSRSSIRRRVLPVLSVRSHVCEC